MDKHLPPLPFSSAQSENLGDGQLVRQLMHQAGLNLTQLADKMGISNQSLGKALQRKTWYSWLIRRASTGLGVDLFLLMSAGAEKREAELERVMADAETAKVVLQVSQADEVAALRAQIAALEGAVKDLRAAEHDLRMELRFERVKVELLKGDSGGIGGVRQGVNG